MTTQGMGGAGVTGTTGAETASQKARRTARWARTMAKWAITRARSKRKWEFVNFTGSAGSESRGIVDLLAIRKDHAALDGSHRGDLFEMILIQVKGGAASWPSDKDVARLRAVQQRYNARAVVLAIWKKGEVLELHQLVPEGNDAAAAGRRGCWTRVDDPVRLFQ